MRLFFGSKLPFLNPLFVLASLAALNGCMSEPHSSSGPDAVGPFETTSAEYSLPESVDPEILIGQTTQIRARLYRPKNWDDKPHPILMFLHGNHATCGYGSGPRIDQNCQYTFDGTCPFGQSEVPSYLGYEYLATRLASFGYVVVSINANRGINCGANDQAHGDEGLILARGRLVLKHLLSLAQWNQAGGEPSSLETSLKNKLDFAQIGLFGHSRGGEGVRAAYNLYKDPGSQWQPRFGELTGGAGLTIKGIFEIGPVDGQSSRTLNAFGTAWNVLLPMCDGDIVDQRGMRVFDRMKAAMSEDPGLPKSMYAVWGANHNFYNTEWQQNESKGCYGHPQLWASEGGSKQQRETALAAVSAFFRAFVGADRDPLLAAAFDPRFSLPDSVQQLTLIHRTFLTSPSNAFTTVLENFQGEEDKGLLGEKHETSGINSVPSPLRGHISTMRAQRISWIASSPNTWFQNNWAPTGSSISLAGQVTLDFRISRADSPLNPTENTEMSVGLVGPDGSIGPTVKLSKYIQLMGPPGSLGEINSPMNVEITHLTLPTVRIPLQDLGNFTAARGVRFILDSTATGEVFIADIGLSAQNSDYWSSLAAGSDPKELTQLLSPWTPQVIQPTVATSPSSLATLNEAQKQIRNRIVVATPMIEANLRKVEIVVESSIPFRVRNALPALRLGDKTVATGSFDRSGDLKRIIFKVNADQLDDLPEEFKMGVYHLEDARGEVRDYGWISKSRLR